jgi:hypothetical protein
VGGPQHPRPYLADTSLEARSPCGRRLHQLDTHEQALEVQQDDQPIIDFGDRVDEIAPRIWDALDLVDRDRAYLRRAPGAAS